MKGNSSLPPRWVTGDGKILVAARGMRNLGQATLSVLIAIYLDHLGFSLFQIGAFISAGLAGSAFFAFVVGLVADSLGRRRLLVTFTLTLLASILALALTDNFLLLAVVAFLGSFNVAGPGGGPHQPLEQAMLADACPAERRTDLFAIYGIVGHGASALGALAAGLPDILEKTLQLQQPAAYKATFLASGAMVAIAAVLYGLLSSSSRVAATSGWVNPLRLPSRKTILTLSGLFTVDHFAGGLVAQSLVSYWFFTRFGIQLGSLAVIFFSAQVLSAASLWLAAKLANRFGLVNTMVFTHIPSNLFMIAVPLVPVAWLAVLLWQARSFLGQMDVPTRDSYTMAVVGPEERVAMASVSTVSRSIAVSASPSVATALWNAAMGGIPFILCGVLKISYDLSLYFLFRNVKPPEERDKKARTATASTPAGPKGPLVA